MKFIVEISVQLTVVHPLGALVNVANAFVSFVTQVWESAMFKMHEIVIAVAALLPVPCLDGCVNCTEIDDERILVTFRKALQEVRILQLALLVIASKCLGDASC